MYSILNCTSSANVESLTKENFRLQEHRAQALCIQKHLQNKEENRRKAVYFNGTYIDERDAPIPGVPCLTGLLVIANSPR
jgi:hypothetical protein